MSSKLKMRDAEFMRLFEEFGFLPGQLAREYEVHVDTVRKILRGKSFKPGSPEPSRSRLRKLADDQVRDIRRWSDEEGHSDLVIERMLSRLVTKSTIRQVVDRKTYQDVT